MENKYLQIKKENVFARFANFIKGILGKKVEQEIPTKVEVVEKKIVKSNFFDEIRMEREEDKDLLDLQSKYENNEIDLSVMSNEELHELNLLYKRQVSDLKEKLDDKKAQLEALKNKIKNYSADM